MRAAIVGFVLMVLVGLGCATFSAQDAVDVGVYGAELTDCQVRARTANSACKADGGEHCDPPARAAYYDCTREGGL